MAIVNRRNLALILTAERLFGDHGVDGISLREISAQAGHKNVYAAQYYFGDKTGIINAILAYRRPVLDEYRKSIIERSRIDLNDLSIEDILKVIYWPMFLQKDANGHRTYSHFIRAVFQYDIFTEITRLGEASEFTALLYARIRDQLTELDEDTWWIRSTTTVRSAVWIISDYDRGSFPDLSDDEILSEIVAMNSAALRGVAKQARVFADPGEIRFPDFSDQ